MHAPKPKLAGVKPVGIGRSMTGNAPDQPRPAIQSATESALAVELEQRSKDLARISDIARAVALSATELLRSFDPDQSIPNVLATIGASAGISRIHVCEDGQTAGGKIAPVPLYRWDAQAGPTAGVARADAQDAATDLCGLGLGLSEAAKSEPLIVVTRTADAPLQETLQAMGILSLVVVPILVDRQRWGHMGFADRGVERAWTGLEIDAMKTIAELIGAAVTRARDLKALSDAGRIVENSPAVLYRLDPSPPHALIYVSRNVSRYGYRAEQLLSAPTRYLELVHPSDVADVTRDLQLIAEGRAAEANRQRRIRAADGHYVWFEDRTRALHDDNRRVVAIEGILVDIDERKEADAQLARYSSTDPLTGLANRKAFMEELGHWFAAAQRGAMPFAIHYLDLDNFKDINDVLGHPKGDELLRLVTDRLKAMHRPTDLIARLGGDEFAILQSDVSDPSVAGTLGARILQELSQPYDLGTQVHVTASIGIAVYSREIPAPEEMIKRADLALYRAKDLGRNQYHFHSEQLDIAIIERVTLAADLRRAIDRGEMELYYQPQVDIRSRRIVGLEALIRWHHPKHGLLCPTRFIPVAERTGTILPLGRWVVDSVCRQIAEWRAQGIEPPPVALNVSAVQLKSMPEFDRDLAQSLERWNVEPGALELELTESVLMEATREHGETIDRLRALGVAIAIDDFGTGYSSLSYLRSYRVNHIKIAQEFIQNLEHDTGDVAIVRAAISLARELGIGVIAEGVETEYQLKILTEAGCHYVQGFYFSHAVPAAQAGALLRHDRFRRDSDLARDGGGS